MVKIVAEGGCNHKGDFEIAKELVESAKNFCGADIIKFQKRTPKELLSEKEYNTPHPNPDNSYGLTYGQHREFLEFSIDQHAELKTYCESLGIEYSCSVWDMTSTKEMVDLNPLRIKIPSPRNLEFNMLEYLVKHYKGEIHISFGMTTKKEQLEIASILYPVLDRVVFYACTSGYPISHKEVCLLELNRMRRAWYGKLIKGYGFSGHHLGIAVDMGAITLGVQYIERHFTLDRTWKGTDHAASLEPDGLRKLVRDAKALQDALRYKVQDMLPVEIEQRKKFGK